MEWGVSFMILLGERSGGWDVTWSILEDVAERAVTVVLSGLLSFRFKVYSYRLAKLLPVLSGVPLSCSEAVPQDRASSCCEG